MKKTTVFFFLFLIITLPLSAQQKTWSKAHSQIYGTEQEYLEQVKLRTLMGYDFYRLIGYKSFYTNGPSSFLQQAKAFSMNAFEDKSRLVYILSAGSGQRNDTGVRLMYWLDEQDRVVKARFKGNKSDLAFLFLNYWPSSTDWTDESQLTKGVLAQKEVLGEQIEFNFQRGKPFIEVRKID